MKFKKLLASALIVGSALTLAAGLAACGPTDPNPNPNPGPTETVISYQFTGYNDELSGYGWAYSVMLNLWSDGTVSGSGYNYGKGNDSPWEENSDFKEKWFRGSWKEEDDEDAGTYVKLTAIWGDDARNDQTSASTAGRLETYSLYFDDDGTTLLPFVLKIPLMSERNADMTCHVPAIYADNDEFIQGSLEEAANRKPSDGGDEEDYGNVIATLTAADSKEAVFYDSGVVVIDAGMSKPVLAWKYENETFTFTETDGNNKGQVTTAAVLTVEGTTGTLTYDFMGYMSFTYTGDVSALIGAEAEPTILATLSTTDGKTAVFYDDGIVKVDTGMAMLSPVWNWKYENGEITFTEEGKDTAPGGVTFEISGTTGTLTYAPSFSQGQTLTYTGDVSALLK